MAIRARKLTRRRELKDTEEGWLHGDRERSGFIKFKRPERVQELWTRYGDAETMRWESGMRLPDPIVNNNH